MTKADKVIAFIERYCFVPEGALVGQPIKLEVFQLNYIREVYDNPHGTSHGILSIGRKNGKTALIACLLLAHLVGPGNSKQPNRKRSIKPRAGFFSV